MASQTQGIQQLLAAEKRAAEKVSEARKRKAKRLKQAKEEAQDEVEKYRQERERQFKEFEAKHMGTREGVAAKIEAETKVKIEEMNRMVEQQKAGVIRDILNLVYDIKPELHVNYRFNSDKPAIEEDHGVEVLPTLVESKEDVAIPEPESAETGSGALAESASGALAETANGALAETANGALADIESAAIAETESDAPAESESAGLPDSEREAPESKSVVLLQTESTAAPQSCTTL